MKPIKTSSLRVRRNTVLFLVGVALLLTSNFLFGLQWFGGYDAEVAILSFAVVYVVDYLIGLTQEELLELRTARNHQDND